MNLTITISEEAKQLIGSMDNRDGKYDRALMKALDLQNQLTIGYAQQRKLTGPRPQFLGVVTNRLRSSLNATPAAISGTEIESAIGSNVAYAAAHEFGFDGNVQVRAFTRRNIRRDLFSVKKRKLSAAGVSYVKAHTRHMMMPERSFIRSSIAERRPQYDAALSKAVLSALGGAT
jgi:phage gpG-like protein